MQYKWADQRVAAWRQDSAGTYRWDFIDREEGEAAGTFIIRRDDPNREGQRCLWAPTTTEREDVYLTCTEGTRGIGPGAAVWERLLGLKASNVSR